VQKKTENLNIWLYPATDIQYKITIFLLQINRLKMSQNSSIWEQQ